MLSPVQILVPCGGFDQPSGVLKRQDRCASFTHETGYLRATGAQPDHGRVRSTQRQHCHQPTLRAQGDVGEHHSDPGIFSSTDNGAVPGDHSAVVVHLVYQLSAIHDYPSSRGRRRLHQRTSAPAERSTVRHHASVRRQRLGCRGHGLDQLDNLSCDGTGHVLGQALRAQLRDRQDR